MNKFFLYAVAAGVAFVNPVKALTLSGPGGGGSAAQVGNTFTFDEYFTGVGINNYLNKSMDNLSSGTPYTLAVNVRNDSGLTWSDFHFAVIGSPQIATLDNPTSTVFTTVTPSAGGSSANWIGGTVADDAGSGFDDVSFSFKFTPTQSGSFTVQQYASVPGPLPFLGIGILLGSSRKLRKRFNNRKTSEMMSAIG